MSDVEQMFYVPITSIEQVFRRGEKKILLSNVTASRHEQLLLWLTQSPATYLSSGLCFVRETKRIPAQWGGGGVIRLS